MTLRNPLKLRIMKKFEISSNWRRFKEVGKIIIDNNSVIKSEAQLCKYMYDHWGEGRMMILCWQKGQEGFFRYFLGNLYPNGFIRDIDKSKELEKLKTELSKAGSYDEREQIAEEIDFERDITQIEKQTRRRGPYGLIKSRVGVLNPYQEY